MNLILKYLKNYKLLFFFNVISVFGFILVELGIPTIVATMIDVGVTNKDISLYSFSFTNRCEWNNCSRILLF